MLIVLTGDPTSYVQSTPDSIVLNLNVEDLKKWNVKYLVSNPQASVEELLNTNGISTRKLYTDDASNEEIIELIY